MGGYQVPARTLAYPIAREVLEYPFVLQVAHHEGAVAMCKVLLRSAWRVKVESSLAILCANITSAQNTEIGPPRALRRPCIARGLLL